jgi:hypothetical protein
MSGVVLLSYALAIQRNIFRECKLIFCYDSWIFLKKWLISTFFAAKG